MEESRESPTDYIKTRCIDHAIRGNAVSYGCIDDLMHNYYRPLSEVYPSYQYNVLAPLPGVVWPMSMFFEVLTEPKDNISQISSTSRPYAGTTPLGEIWLTTKSKLEVGDIIELILPGFFINWGQAVAIQHTELDIGLYNHGIQLTGTAVGEGWSSITPTFLAMFTGVGELHDTFKIRDTATAPAVKICEFLRDSLTLTKTGLVLYNCYTKPVNSTP